MFHTMARCGVCVLLCALAVAQHKTSSAKTRPSPTGLFNIRLVPDPDLSIALPDNMPAISAQCDSDGNPYVKTAGPDGLQILGFTSKGVITFATKQMTDIAEPRAGNFFVGPLGISILVTGTENARRQEVTYTDEDGRESKHWETTGEQIRYIARFDRDGSYRGSLKLDFDLNPTQLAAFDSGGFLIAGIDNDKIPRVGLLNSSGQLLKYIQLPKDMADDPKAAEKSFAASGLTATADVMAIFAQFYYYKGTVLLVRSVGGTPTYEIRDTGAVRAVRVHIPNGLTIDHFISSDRNWFIDAREGFLSHGGDTIYEVSPENGKLLRQYWVDIKNNVEESISCEAQSEFIGIRHRDGKLTVLHGTAEATTQKQAH